MKETTFIVTGYFYVAVIDWLINTEVYSHKMQYNKNMI